MTIEIVFSLDPGNDWAIARFVNRKLMGVYFREIPEGQVDVLAVEYPKWYPNSKSHPTAIVRLAYNAGKLVGKINPAVVAEVSTVAIPKSIVQRRVRATLDDLEIENLDRALYEIPSGMRHNCYDSVRHGLVYLGRLAA